MAGNHFSTIADRRKRGPYDAELELRAYTAAALSATTSETGIEFAVRKQDQYKVCLSVGAYTGFDSGTAEWTITVEVSDVVGGTYTQIGPSYIPVGDADEYEIPLSGALVTAVDADAEFIRVTATKTGAPGDLTYAAWIVC
ncbi:MAG: hypothetical protein AAF810_05375 [Cyanobacteria bacterium P01_D01_bin.36]